MIGESSEEALAKIDAVISGIRMINLHFYNFLNDNPIGRKDGRLPPNKQKILKSFKDLNMAHTDEQMNYIHEYLRRTIKDMAKIRLVLAPLTMRPLRKHAQEDSFLRFENAHYGVKFVVNDLYRECLLSVETYRRDQGARTSGLANKKLDNLFISDLSQKYPEGMISQASFEKEGASMLGEVTLIFSGEKCHSCKRYMVFSLEEKAFLPPTVREEVEGEERVRRYYYHQACL